MRKYKTILFFLIAWLGLFTTAQAQSLDYRTLAADSTGQVYLNQNISLRVSIMQGSKSNPVIYCEKFTITSDTTGFANFTFGNGTVVSGSFGDINWGAKNYAKVETDPAAGSNFGKVGNAIVDTVTHMLVTNQ